MTNEKSFKEKQPAVVLVLLIFLIVGLTVANIVVFLTHTIPRDTITQKNNGSNEFYTIDQEGNRVYTAKTYEKVKNLAYDDKDGIEEVIKILSHDEIEEYISDYKKVGSPNLVCSTVDLNTAGYPAQIFYKFGYDETGISLINYSTINILYTLDDDQALSYDLNMCETEFGKSYDTCDYRRIGYDLLYNVSTANGELIPTRYKNASLQDLYVKFEDSSINFYCEISN